MATPPMVTLIAIYRSEIHVEAPLGANTEESAGRGSLPLALPCPRMTLNNPLSTVMIWDSDHRSTPAVDWS